MVGCGNMDGKITTSVESTQLPAKDDEANFGKGYGYQFGADYTLLVYWDDEPISSGMWILWTRQTPAGGTAFHG